eukprot:942648-Prorocentrum_minimum.AAC.2
MNGRGRVGPSRHEGHAEEYVTRPPRFITTNRWNVRVMYSRKTRRAEFCVMKNVPDNLCSMHPCSDGSTGR